MARIINVEKSQYLTQNIENFTQNKVGQYSRFLDKNPLFVTWLSINRIQSRHDVGTGGVESDVGPKSPIRFNQVNGLPTYNVPELKPDVDYGENGYDINMDISDGTLLPGTIHPQVGDYLIIKLPNSEELAFRVNQFSYNTIQSNDFYQYSADLKYTGKNLLERFKGQIVDTFETIFDNIGTEDKCFIRSTDVDKIKNVGLLFKELRDHYRMIFFDEETGNFVCKVNDENPDKTDTESWLYDKYTEKFIMDSEIYFSELNDPDSIVLVTADIEGDLKKLYLQTLYSAVLRKDTAYLSRFPWYYQVAIQKPLSVFRLNSILCNSVTLHLTNYPLLDGHSDGLDSTYLMQYMPHALIHKILDDDIYEDEIIHKYDPDKCWKFSELNEESFSEPYDSDDEIDTTDEDLGDEAISEDDTEDLDETEKNEPVEEVIKTCHGCTREGCTLRDLEDGQAYYHPCLDEEYQMTYIDDLIYQFMMGLNLDIDRRKLVQFALQDNNYCYRMMPIVIYIIMQYYNSYFKKRVTDELYVDL